MIKTLQLHNFKAFQDTGRIHIQPLTVLAGPNSGGKSSILQSLLLLKQTLDAPPEVDLSLDGEYLQFSSFRDLTFGKPLLSKCNITFDFTLELPIPALLFARHLGVPEATRDFQDGPRHTLLQSNISLSFRHRRRDGAPKVVLGSFDVTCMAEGIEGPRLKGTISNNGHKVDTPLDELDLPERFRGRNIRGVGGRHFSPEFLIFETTDDSHRSFMPLRPLLSFPIQDLRTELEDNLQYLGPLRERPQRAYLHSGNSMTDIGESGQYAAQILWIEKDELIQYRATRNEEARQVTLMEAVSDSFRRLGLLQPVDVSAEKSIMYQILFGIGSPNARKSVTIADVGFGVSQLLPILLLGLRSDEASLLILEQPEIHLHPRLQANLADFLLALASSGKRIIVETHSDHFINRLRRRIAEDDTDALKDQVNILFVQPPDDDEVGATIEPLRVDRFGVIENWPNDFLPEAADEAEAIFIAGLRKRR